MPNYLSVGDAVEVTVFSQLQSQFSANVCHFSVVQTSMGSATDAEALTALDAVIAPLWKIIMSTSANYWGMRLQIFGPTRKVAQFLNSSFGAGTSMGDVMSSQTAGLLKVQTNKAGKRYNGRMYLPFPSELQNDANGVPTTNYVGDANTMGAALFANQTTVGAAGTALMVPVIYSRKYGTQEVVTSAMCERFWATQQRRATRRRGDIPPS